MNLYVIRHCQTENNLTEIIQGQTDSPVTETGKKQLKALSFRFKDIPLDVIFTSPIGRAKATALAVKGEKDIPLIEAESLKEVNCGKMDGMPASKAKLLYGDIWDKHIKDVYIADFPDGETGRHLFDRAKGVIDRVLRQYGDSDKNIALVTHGGIMRVMLSYILTGSPDISAQMPWSGNTAVYLYSYRKENGFTALAENDTAHLKNVKGEEEPW